MKGHLPFGLQPVRVLTLYRHYTLLFVCTIPVWLMCGGLRKNASEISGSRYSNSEAKSPLSLDRYAAFICSKFQVVSCFTYDQVSHFSYSLVQNISRTCSAMYIVSKAISALPLGCASALTLAAIILSNAARVLFAGRSKTFKLFNTEFKSLLLSSSTMKQLQSDEAQTIIRS